MKHNPYRKALNALANLSVRRSAPIAARMKSMVEAHLEMLVLAWDEGYEAREKEGGD